MRYEYIEPFINTTIQVLDSVIQTDISKGDVTLVRGNEISGEISIIVRVKGDSDGNIVLNMPVKTALKICNVMFGDNMQTLTPMGMDSIAELANMIAGNATSVLNDLGHDLRVLPPLIYYMDEIRGKTADVEAFQVPLFTEYGEILMSVALTTN